MSEKEEKYLIGSKVVIQSEYTENMKYIYNGCTCIVKRIVRTSKNGMPLLYPRYYLQLCEKNLSRRQRIMAPHFRASLYSWYEHDFTKAPPDRPFILLDDLPDV